MKRGFNDEFPYSQDSIYCLLRRSHLELRLNLRAITQRVRGIHDHLVLFIQALDNLHAHPEVAADNDGLQVDEIRPGVADSALCSVLS